MPETVPGNLSPYAFIVRVNKWKKKNSNFLTLAAYGDRIAETDSETLIKSVYRENYVFTKYRE